MSESINMKVCARSCSFLSSCVRCHIEQNCPSSCDHVSIVSPSEHNNTDEELRTCSITEDNCEVTYQVGVYVLGTEGNIMVIFDETQSDINDWSAGCSSSFPIFVIPLVVTIGIILLAIIVIALWVAMKYLIEYLEFRAWKKSQEDELWNTSGDNPLFVDPTTSHINPKYRPRTTVQVVGGEDD
ncbi:PREDICTED: integrin beta-1-B-like [Amphimedon queenslandica]|uniref:Integrin beta subunit cytoplasmic domain-containing protein n=1 Tax=Amphimedon queenslandica TaxID=400682 RepID=A0A1X7TAY1_AMPQE|nr:PREDICTED: integrin beta-1-B-like [Amphimedon queenslandica]|eukprot:XP_019860561.1 PREDICTED: integrin beta-1-B-like [Amphimedon queenslandica]